MEKLGSKLTKNYQIAKIYGSETSPQPAGGENLFRFRDRYFKKPLLIGENSVGENFRRVILSSENIFVFWSQYTFKRLLYEKPRLQNFPLLGYLQVTPFAMQIRIKVYSRVFLEKIGSEFIKNNQIVKIYGSETSPQPTAGENIFGFHDCYF